MSGGWFDPEAIEDERFEADMLQAQYEAEGNAAAERQRKVDALKAEGRLEEAVKVCSHGYVGLLKGTCSQDDPRYGEEGSRCYDCGAVVTDINGWAIHVR